jgi:hypothetical protein
MLLLLRPSAEPGDTTGESMIEVLLTIAGIIVLVLAVGVLFDG